MSLPDVSVGNCKYFLQTVKGCCASFFVGFNGYSLRVCVCKHRVLVGKPEGKKPLGRPRRRWEDNIKMDLQEVGGGGGDWLVLARNRDRWRAFVNTVMNIRVR